LHVTLKNWLMIQAAGLTAPAAVLENLTTTQLVEVWMPTLDGRWLILPRHTQPKKASVRIQFRPYGGSSTSDRP
jgi:hypothetical protein